MSSKLVSSRCLVRGSINIDEFFHVKDIVRPGETISSTSLSRRAGGKGANQAVAVAKAGGNVSLIGAIGEDGTWVRDQLESFGVCVRDVNISEGSTGRALIQLAESGENSIILYKGANHVALPSPKISVFATYTHLLLQNEVPLTSTLLYLTLAKSSTLESPITTIYNPSPMPSSTIISTEMKWEYVDWLVVNEGEAQQLLNSFCHFSTPDLYSGNCQSQLPFDLPDCAIRSSVLLSQLACQASFKNVNIVCTLGSSGVLASLLSAMGDRQVIYEPAVPVKNVVDTTGAGDCWTGYLAAGLMDIKAKQWSVNLDKEQAHKLLRRCNQAAAMCVEKHGAMESIPRWEEVDTRLLR